MKDQIRRRPILAAAAAMGLAGIMAGCGGGSDAVVSGDGPGPAANLTGIALPSEISAVSAETESPVGASLARTLKAMSAKAAAALPASSDYQKTETIKYVDEPALEVFGMVETVLQAVAQTKYAEADSVGQGAYKAMVAWEEEMDGKTQKSLQEWTVQSEMTTEDGSDVNLLSMWMEMEDEVIRAQMKIYEAPTQDADGNYLNYGKWTLNAQFTDMISGDPLGGFYADADVDPETGLTRMRMVDAFEEMEDVNGTPITMQGTTRAIMYKGATQGYGKVAGVNWDYCWDVDWSAPDAESPCVTEAVAGVMSLPIDNIQYAYNQGYLAYQQGADTVYKDRSDKAEIAYRYGVFDAETGEDVAKTRSFGFPIRFEAEGATRHAYYGAWQGRHQIWTPDGTLPDGTLVTKEDVAPGEEAPTYTSQTIGGAFTKRLLTVADLDQIKGIPVEIWLNEFFFLIWDAAGSQWVKCADTDMVWGPEPGAGPGPGPDAGPTCSAPQAFDMASLIVDPNTDRKHVMIGRWDPETGHTELVCDPENSPGSNLVRRGDNAPYAPADGEMVNVNISGSIYVEYTGDFTGGATGWREKTLTAFDSRNWTPTFGEEDVEYVFPFNPEGENREMYINNKGTNFIVRRTAAADEAASYQAKMEIQQVANPLNAGELVTAGWRFKEPWNDNGVTYRFNADAASPNYLLLEYATADAANNKEAGDVVTKDMWGLTAYDNDVAVQEGGQPIQFNWEYAESPGDWGSVTYLKDGSEFVLLDDPLMFDPLHLTSMAAGDPGRSYSLQFDGWMHGLPDMRWELKKVDYQLTDQIKDKITNIPAGTEVTSSLGETYYVKPLEVGVILKQLGAAPADGPDLNLADGIDLAEVPDPEVTIGDKPAGAVLRYVEGKLVQ